MTTDMFRITNGLWFEYNEFCGVSINYIERSPDSWYSDTETDVDLDKENAIKLIEWLTDKYNLKGQNNEDEQCISK